MAAKFEIWMHGTSKLFIQNCHCQIRAKRITGHLNRVSKHLLPKVRYTVRKSS